MLNEYEAAQKSKMNLLDNKITENDIRKRNEKDIIIGNSNRGDRFFEPGLSIGSSEFNPGQANNSVEDDLRILDTHMKSKPNFSIDEGLMISAIESACKQGNAPILNFTGESLSKELANNNSLYSGGSSLIGLNYAFGEAPVVVPKRP